MMDDYEESGAGLLGELSGSQRHGRAALFGYTVAASQGHAQAWFDVRVIYVRVTGCPLDDAPDSLTIRFPARSIGTALEVNGGRISPSEEANLTLRRDRVDTESSEATYLSTDNLRTSGSLNFEVMHKEEVLVSGFLEHSQPAADVEDYNEAVSTPEKSTKLGWTMECSCVVGQSGCVFLKGRHDYPNISLAHPVMEVCMVGRFSGTPVILTQTVHILARRRPNRQATLDAIPEAEEVRSKQLSFVTADQPRLKPQPDLYMDPSDKAFTNFGYALEGGEYGDQDNGQMTWFNAGVRVGVGIGLGMCLGVGIGVGLMVRTYQATTRTFRRGFL